MFPLACRDGKIPGMADKGFFLGFEIFFWNLCMSLLKEKNVSVLTSFYSYTYFEANLLLQK